MSAGVGVALLVGALTLSGCAGTSATAPVKTTASHTSHEAAPSPAPTTAPEAEKRAEGPAPSGIEPPPAPAPFEPEPDAAGTNPGEEPEDVEPAEEVEPSPLDEIPGEVPPATAAELQREKDIVAAAPMGYDIPMVLNDRVAAYVDYFTSRGHDFLEGSLDRSNKYVTIFQSVFEQAGIPKDLVYMAHVESGFKTSAYSRAKARGIFQFISGTGRRYGLRVDGWIDERADPMKSAQAAAAYLKDLYGMFGDWYLALAAYNAGEGKIQRGMARTGKADFWSLASTRTIRSETKNYVPMILAATIIAKEPVKFGFPAASITDAGVEKVGIAGQTDLRILARMIDVEPESLREMNPHLRRGVTAPDGVTDIYVPRGQAGAMRAAYAALPEGDRMILARHSVSTGESPSSIAHHYGISLVSLQRSNGLGKESKLKAGQELVIPAVATPAPDADVVRHGSIVYKVRRGDTLGAIARRYRTSPGAIARASGVSASAPIRVGQRLRIPGNRAAATASSKSPTSKAAASIASNAAASGKTVVHTVRRGETLYAIAGLYQVTVDQICALNKISPGGVLYPGKRLKITN
jgi:membrane-bound lytic murein transglycosylase D